MKKIFYKKLNRCGFTLVEILVVVGIVALLASLSAPVVIQHRRRAMAMEPLGVMALIREAMRDHYINAGAYYDVTSNNIQQAPTTGVDVDAGVTRYFSNHAYTIDGTTPVSARFTSPGPVDFLIVVNGNNSTACSSSVLTNCATSAAAVSTFRLEMDNSGRTFVSYDSGTNWDQLR